VEGCLHGRELLRRAKPFDRRDRGPINGGKREQARPARLAVDEDGAGSAAALLATRLGARDPQLLAKHV